MYAFEWNVSVCGGGGGCVRAVVHACVRVFNISLSH